MKTNSALHMVVYIIRRTFINRLLFITLLFIVIDNFNTFGQKIIYADPHGGSKISIFEDRDSANYFYIDTIEINNLWQIGKPSKSIFDSAYSAPFAIVTDTLNTYSNDNKSSFEFRIVSSDATFISFWHRFNTDSLADGGVIEVSTDDGSSWINVIDDPRFSFYNFYSSSNTISSNNNKSGFTGNSDWINSIIQGPPLKRDIFRFTFTSDNINTKKDGWMIDNFEFICLGTNGIIKGTELNSKIKLYPNPTINELFVDIAENIKLQNVKVVDALGQIIYQDNEKVINTINWKCGLYFVEIVTNQGIITKKLIKN